MPHGERGSGPTEPSWHSHGSLDASDVGLCLLRLFVGPFVVYHGLQEVVHPAELIQVVTELGVPLPSISAWLVMLGHLGLGVLLAVGLFTRGVGVLLAVMFLLIFYTYYVQRFDTTLALTGSGTLWGVESMSYAATGVLFASLGAGRLSLDRLVRTRWGGGPSPSSPLPSRLGRTVQRIGAWACSQPSQHPRDVGLLVFRLFIGGLLILHGVTQIVSRNQVVSENDSMAILADKLAGLGVPMPTVAAWTATAVMLVVGVLLIIGLFTRAAGIALAVVAAVLFLAIPDRGGTVPSVPGGGGVGFHGEEFVFLATIGIFFACMGTGRFAVSRRDRRPQLGQRRDDRTGSSSA